ncbi:MAG TPA: dihydroxyacetone kinase subunit L [Firmicutes bacterium]|jgi:phosphoenolpyruvate---glycerone phosphotransferase subunit DhaL|nr:dihydroxyacetone kinase subunit L [Bacillota bacterium]
MDYIVNADSSIVIYDLIAAIQKQKDYLSEIDGAIGDGDHGVNMNKGFTLCQEKLKQIKFNLAEGLHILGKTLLMEIGGSMGPLYGTFFIQMSKVCKEKEQIDKYTFGLMMESALQGLQTLVSAKVGDKTLIDTLAPAGDAYQDAVRQGKNFKEALVCMKEAAEKGKDATKNMVAMFGRASRLGERSRGTLDAGATSCYIILSSMADSICGILH